MSVAGGHQPGMGEGRRPLVVGLLASPGLPSEVAEDLVKDLPDALSHRFDHVEWQVVLDDEPLAGATRMRAIKDVAKRRRRSQRWDFAVCLTDVPLRSGRRPVTAHASAQHRVGLVSVPALGPIDVEQRVLDAVMHLIEGMLGESAGRGGGRNGPRHARLLRRLEELSSPLGRARMRDEGTIRFTTATVRGNLRLILGMVRANNPSLVVVRLSRALAAAFGTAAISLTSVNVWLLADGSDWPRLLGVSIGTIAATCVALIVAHGLWEHADDPDEREQVIMFNLATLLTVLIGVATLYLALFVTTLVCSGALIPIGVFNHQTGHAQALADYVQLAWLVASLATIGGALGSVIESDLAVHDAMYRYHSDERTENAA
jgi:hypothetical protein